MAEELTQDQIEERIKLMKENCPFCKIIKGEFDAKKIFEDDICLAILDINPASNGHILLMPKEHYIMLPMVPDEVLGHLSVISKYLCDLLKESLGAVDVSIFMANGAAAGQQSQHFMMHVIPRYENDGIDFSLHGQKISDAELKDIAQKIKDKLSSLNSKES